MKYCCCVSILITRNDDGIMHKGYWVWVVNYYYYYYASPSLSRSNQPYPTEEDDDDEKSFQINPKKSSEKSPPATIATEAPLWASMDSMCK
jgi:hypothetical protein